MTWLKIKIKSFLPCWICHSWGCTDDELMKTMADKTHKTFLQCHKCTTVRSEYLHLNFQNKKIRMTLMEWLDVISLKFERMLENMYKAKRNESSRN